MLVYMAQTTPGRLYDIFPFAVLLGTMLGLGGLAGSNELVAMRAIGYDRSRILGGVLLTTGACLAVLVVFAEFVIPDRKSVVLGKECYSLLASYLCRKRSAKYLD